MKQPLPEELVEIAEELDDLEADCDWRDSCNLWCLVCAAQHCGFLPGVSVHQLVPLGRRDDFFLITVEVTPTLVLGTAPIHWREIEPPAPGTGTAAISHLLARIGDECSKLLVAFHENAASRFDE
ncbi:hypothetical protein P6B95_17960 [Streptomyces atratus]|uniref:hypothetical protein n=1 Tax=Streptomyces atratus TaxID=1893 RepID=UPI002AC34B81|nr:hypothetical protein [Streptomyces atratus]WPW29084.1 hypothetical protein P6B95_17960 [Streptomyces atratus]